LNHNLLIERRHSLRHKVNTPAFASFDGVTGGMVLDLSEEGMSMQALAPIEEQSIMSLNVTLEEPTVCLETTGYVAWADALGRAGVRFADLPDDARSRLRYWLSQNASTRSLRAPRWVVRDSRPVPAASQTVPALGVSLETASADSDGQACSTSIQYEFKSLAGGDLSAALNIIASRACVITRGTGAAVALAHKHGMVCQAVAGNTAPPVGAKVEMEAGFSGECIRLAKPIRCDDTQVDPRVDHDACRELGIRRFFTNGKSSA
jgi:hypothetical protein